MWKHLRMLLDYSSYNPPLHLSNIHTKKCRQLSVRKWTLNYTQAAYKGEHTHIDRKLFTAHSYAPLPTQRCELSAGVNCSLQAGHNAAACGSTPTLTARSKELRRECREERGAGQWGGHSHRKGGACACTCTSGHTLEAKE